MHTDLVGRQLDLPRCRAKRSRSVVGLAAVPDRGRGLHVGICSGGGVEAFYYSEEPLLICPPPVVPL
jgi:hypothetical protein